MSSFKACWKCGADLPAEKITFRVACTDCKADLHTCVNCVYYQPGKPNDCSVPGTDYVADRIRANFCEDFQLKGVQVIKKGPSKEDIAQRLFKN